MNAIIEQINFHGKQVWVTGAGSGIGLEIAHTFSRMGAEVIGLDCRFEACRLPFTKQLLDLRDANAINTVCEKLLAEKFDLDVLVNAAGVLKLGPIETLSLQDWQACLDVNLTGVFLLTQQLIPVFKRQKRGAIVNIASNAARVPRMAMAAYCASKSALESFSHCCALELAKCNVRCNVISPGSTDTPMLQSMLGDEQAVARTIAGSLSTYKNGIPLGKLAHPRDIANSVVFLASDLASHITMQNLVIDGGATLSA